jgi:hypothetical protein
LKGLPTALTESIAKLNTVLPSVSARGAKAEFFIGLTAEANSGINFDATLLKELSQQAIELSFDLSRG